MTKTSDGLQRTDWFGPEVSPTVPGLYECCVSASDGGYIFQRRWNGTDWISTITHEPTKVRMYWRGVVTGSISTNAYAAATRPHLFVAGSATQTLAIAMAGSIAQYGQPDFS